MTTMGERTIGSNARGVLILQMDLQILAAFYGFMGGREFDSLTMMFFCGWFQLEHSTQEQIHLDVWVYIFYFGPYFQNPPHGDELLRAGTLTDRPGFLGSPFFGKAAAFSCSHSHGLAGLPT